MITTRVVIVTEQLLAVFGSEKEPVSPETQDQETPLCSRGQGLILQTRLP